MIKYFLERADTNEWFVQPPLEVFVHSNLYGTLSGNNPDEWTNDPQMAMQWTNKVEAEEYLKKYFPANGYLITEHEFL